MNKYLKLDLEAIRRDFPQVYATDEFEVTPMLGAYREYEVKPGQYTIPGDFKTFHFLLTKK